MDNLLNLLGEVMEVLTNPFLGEDMARLDGMLVVNMMNMFIGMEMVMLMLVVLMFLMDIMMMLSMMFLFMVFVVVAALDIFGAAGNGHADGNRDCAKRNEREGQSHGKDFRNKKKSNSENVQ